MVEITWIFPADICKGDSLYFRNIFQFELIIDRELSKKDFFIIEIKKSQETKKEIEKEIFQFVQVERDSHVPRF